MNLRNQRIDRSSLFVAGVFFALLISLGACAGEQDASSEADAGGQAVEGPHDYSVGGPHPVGNVTVTLTDVARGGRTLRVEIWYPADDSAAAAASKGEPVEIFAEPGSFRDDLAVALAASPTQCTSQRTHSARDAKPLTGSQRWPLVAFSHCHLCARFSSFSLAEQLASHGIAVVAPDHTGGTLFDKALGKNEGLTPAFLATRVGDIRFVLDQLLGDGAGLPEALRGRFDPDRVGVFGHSFGSVTAGAVLEKDPRVKAAACLYAPLESPLLPGVSLAKIDKPLLFFVATEDNSITEYGNKLIRKNFQEANPPVWKVEMVDAGHLSVSDLCGLADGFKPGCGEGTRQTKAGEPFVYLGVQEARGLAKVWLGNYFGRFLRDEVKAKKWLETPPMQNHALVEMRLK